MSRFGIGFETAPAPGGFVRNLQFFAPVLVVKSQKVLLRHSAKTLGRRNFTVSNSRKIFLDKQKQPPYTPPAEK
jgi:hypothetical protein